MDVNTSQPRHDMPDAKPVGVAPEGHNARMFSVVFSPNGHMVAADLEDAVVDVWETNTGKRRRIRFPRPSLLWHDAGLLPRQPATGDRQPR